MPGGAKQVMPCIVAKERESDKPQKVVRGMNEHIYELDGPLEQEMCGSAYKYFAALVLVGTIIEEVCDTPDLCMRAKRTKKLSQLMSAKRFIENTITAICGTIPPKRYKMIKRDIAMSTIYMKHTGACEANDKDKYALADIEQLKVLIHSARDMTCVFCELKGKDAKKCKFRKAYENVFCNTVDTHFMDGDGICPLSGVSDMEDKVDE